MEMLHRHDYEYSAGELAKWLDEQRDAYWTVDGDPLLSGRLSVPCPSDELASEIRSVNKPLIVLGPPSMPPTAKRPSLDELVETEELGTNVLQIHWKDSDRLWLLIRDKETETSISESQRP
jgi:hypothetical protein